MWNLLRKRQLDHVIDKKTYIELNKQYLYSYIYVEYASSWITRTIIPKNANLFKNCMVVASVRNKKEFNISKLFNSAMFTNAELCLRATSKKLLWEKSSAHTIRLIYF